MTGRAGKDARSRSQSRPAAAGPDPLVRAQIVESLRGTKKYRYVCEDSLLSVVSWAQVRHRSSREILKAAKRKLHQVYGAFFEHVDFAEMEGRIEALSLGVSLENAESVCRQLLRGHASSAERLDNMEEALTDVFRHTGRPETVLDLACGLNPFALPWMGLGPDVEYHALDIDSRLIASVNAFFARLGRPRLALCADILVSPPRQRADVALLLKTAPCLEQQRKGATAELLGGLNARWAVVSFPTESLGGRDKGMYEHYGSFMAGLVGGLGLSAHEMRFPGEVFYLVELGG